MSDPDREPDDPARPEESHASPYSGRRAILVAMPAILSLRSGAAAAHARSSNVLVVADFVAKDQDVFCVKRPWGAKDDPRGWDLGPNPPTLEATRIPSDRQFYRKTGKDSYTPVSAQTMCRDGGNYYYKAGERYESDAFDGDLLASVDGAGALEDGTAVSTGKSGWFGEEAGVLGGSSKDGGKGWKAVSLKEGAMCSATALASFASVHIKDI